MSRDSIFVSVRQKLRTAAYAGLFGGVVAVFGGVMYTLYAELTESSGTYGIVQRAVEKLEANGAVMDRLGPPGLLKVYGRANRYGRRRPHVISRFLEDGTRCLDTSFWVEGRHGSAMAALVTLQVVEDPKTPGRLQERFLAIDIPGERRHILIQPQRPSWSLLSRIFGRK